ncbi:chromosome transmission fidelity protein 18 homolog [Amphiura filiformis]|uniref:chromosome transmission fidelity protein 18 homolog n=1 Tax=Amphiura filiformis TaxID=82378 RepID=UPI003B2168E3
MDDDFEDAFADELDALRDLEEDFYQSSQPIKKLPSQTSAKQKNISKNSLQSGNASSVTNSKAQPHDDEWDIPDDLLADADGFIQAEAASTADVLSTTNQGQEKKSKKRDIEELFGALSDSDNELVIDAPISSPQPKRARKLYSQDKTKNKEEVKKSNKVSETKDPADDFEITPPSSPTADEKALLKVQMLRTRKQNTTSKTSVQPIVPSGLDFRRNSIRKQRVLTRQPAGAFVAVTNQDGRRVYLSKVEKISGDREGGKKSVFKPMPLQLLATSMGTLKLQIEREKHQQIIREAERLSSQIKNAVEEMHSDDDSDEEERSVKRKEPGLWVDKYAPHRYTELLSDDGVNRNLLFWLKLWDQVVFNKEKIVSNKTKKQEEKKNKQPNFKNKWQQQQSVIEELDEHKRPVFTVALLCSPSGLGITTLAHVIARPAGYNVVEMNASDDRSQEVFRTRLGNAIQMKSVLTPDNRPNCLVIDEIDGAPTPAINVLLNMIKCIDGNPNSKKKKKQSLLMRPIICICNDPYVPALRQLRQLAFVTHFPQTLSSRLASRLQQIAKNNALRADMTSLMALCSKADNDIRSCLNTLQFLHSQGTQLTLRLVHSLSVGQKDKHKGLFTVWQDIFQLPKQQRKQYANPHDVHEGIVPNPIHGGNTTGGVAEEASNTSLSARYYNILQEVQAEGDYEKLLQGVFENFLDVRFKDPHLEAVNLSYEWLGFSDLLQTEINHKQNYIFMRYLPFTPVTFHMLFASLSKPQIKYPNTQYEVTTKQSRTSNLITTLLSEVTPRIASNLNPRTLIMDILSHLLLIIQPSFRPVNTQLFSSQEKKQLAELIDTMIGYNLTYHQERSVEGQYNYVLDPNIEEVVRFSGAPPVKQMTYASKQLIAREISLEKMRRTEKNARANNKEQASSKQQTKKQASKDKPTEPAVPRHKEKLQPKKIVVEDKPARDFFGRLIPTKAAQQNKEGSTSAAPQSKQKEKTQLRTSKLWYKFNEGFSNAVRQNIRIQDLL